ncbi:uncharacterized protein [Ranitomeya imitator]|uniref:uncharacterized protein n=1 Tax=Ranitomeya imitator TaxID=111125 RepID=UPI0037E7380B
MWFLNGNQSQSGIFQTSRLNVATVRMSSNWEYLIQHGISRPHILVPLNHSWPPASENLETFGSSQRPRVIYWPALPNTLLSSWEFSSSSSNNKAFIPSLGGHLGSLNPSSFITENVNLLLPSLHLQDLGVQISHIVSPETLHFSALSSQAAETSLDAVTCFVVKPENDDMLGYQEIISGGTDHPFCNEEKLPVELGHHMTQNVLLLLTVKIITIKLIIFDLLMTGAAMVETCQKCLSPKFTEENY